MAMWVGLGNYAGTNPRKCETGLNKNRISGVKNDDELEFWKKSGIIKNPNGVLAVSFLNLFSRF